MHSDLKENLLNVMGLASASTYLGLGFISQLSVHYPCCVSSHLSTLNCVAQMLLYQENAQKLIGHIPGAVQACRNTP